MHVLICATARAPLWLMGWQAKHRIAEMLAAMSKATLGRVQALLNAYTRSMLEMNLNHTWRDEN